MRWKGEIDGILQAVLDNKITKITQEKWTSEIEDPDDSRKDRYDCTCIRPIVWMRKEFVAEDADW